MSVICDGEASNFVEANSFKKELVSGYVSLDGSSLNSDPDSAESGSKLCLSCKLIYLEWSM